MSCWRGIPAATTRSNLLAIVESARAKHPDLPVVLAGMQMPPSMGPDYVREFAAVFPEVARSTGATLIPHLLEGVGGIPRMNQPDLIHPTPEGHERVARNVWKVLEPVLRAAVRKDE
jgi:acyl-CoA thioesterase-1